MTMIVKPEDLEKYHRLPASVAEELAEWLAVNVKTQYKICEIKVQRVGTQQIYDMVGDVGKVDKEYRVWTAASELGVHRFGCDLFILYRPRFRGCRSMLGFCFTIGGGE